jgi:hypothetical protein
MPLIDLKSDLTWRGGKNAAPNKMPNDGNGEQTSRFYIQPSTMDVTTSIKGYTPGAPFPTKAPILLGLKTSKGEFSLKDSQYNFGISTRLTQGGTGYPFPDYNGIIYDWKPSAHTGFSSKSRYGDAAGDGKGDNGQRNGFLKATYTTNSPINAMYRKYNLRDASYQGGNWWSQPYILRGIQVKRNAPVPQRWGFGIGSFDDGLIRGGIVTAIERTAFDVVRLSKWMTSPRGLLWVVKQVGLGLTNPPVERTTGKIALTQIQPGITSLASVAGNAFGLHFTRHAIPFLNDVGSYENVIQQKIRDDATSDEPESNRLYRLRNELLTNATSRGIIRPGLPIPSLSTGTFGTAGVGGAQSILGLTGTPIRRSVDTATDAIVRGLRVFNRLASTYNITNQYAQGLNTTEYLQKRGTAVNDTDKRNQKAIDTTGGIRNSLENALANDTLKERDSFKNPTGTQFEFRSGTQYATLAYGQIPEDKKEFRNFIGGIDDKSLNAIFNADVVKQLKTNYETDNINTQFGYRSYSKNYRNQPTTDLVEKDIVKFKIAGKSFRAYIENISDSLSAEVTEDNVLGSPYKVLRYSGQSRSVSVQFKMAVLYKNDLRPIYDLLKLLQTKALFIQSSNTFTGQTIKVVIGDLYNFTGYIENISYSWDNEMPWEIKEGSQVPMYCNVSIDFKYLQPTAGFKINGKPNSNNSGSQNLTQNN